jgi:hypothetical protein
MTFHNVPSLSIYDQPAQIQQKLKKAKPAANSLRFKRPSAAPKSTQSNSSKQLVDGITYAEDDGTSLSANSESPTVSLTSSTFSKEITPQFLALKLQQLRIQQRLRAKTLKGRSTPSQLKRKGLDGLSSNQQSPTELGSDDFGTASEMISPSMNDDITPQPAQIDQNHSSLTESLGELAATAAFNGADPLQSIAAGSETCHSQIVCCQGCLTPLIIPTTKMLESAYAYANNVANIVLCNCTVCKNTDLVTTCSICHCFLCSDCDQLTQSVLQNCPGCFD